jgi:ATP-binding protein involved in chromosome partitioning
MSLKMYSQKDSSPLSGVSHIIAIAAGKGGVGKSSVTVNLGRALKKQGFSVGIMDIDIYGPSIRKMLPENRLPVQRGEYITPALCEGIRMISMAYFRKENEAAVVRAPIANSLVSQFIKNVDWGELDYLLIDFPPGTGDVQLTISQQANLSGAIMVTTPQEIAIMDVRKAMNMFDQVNIPILGVVENMSHYYHAKTDEIIYIFGKGGGEKLARESGVPFLGAIPIDPKLCILSDKGKSIFEDEPVEEKSSAFSYMQIAERVVDHINLLKKETEHCLHNFELQWKDMSNESF